MAVDTTGMTAAQIAAITINRTMLNTVESAFTATLNIAMNGHPIAQLIAGGIVAAVTSNKAAIDKELNSLGVIINEAA